MGNRFSIVALGLITCSIATGVTFAAQRGAPTPPQTQTYRAPRTKDGRPDLNGIWQAVNTANWDLQAHLARPALAVRPGRFAGTIVPAPPVIAFGAVGAVPAGFGVVEGGQIPYQASPAGEEKA